MDYDFRTALCKNMYVAENVTRRVTNARLFIIRSASRAVIWRHLNFYCLQGRGFYGHFLDVKFLSSAFLFVLRLGPATKAIPTAIFLITIKKIFPINFHESTIFITSKLRNLKGIYSNNDRTMTHDKIYNV